MKNEPGTRPSPPSLPLSRTPRPAHRPLQDFCPREFSNDAGRAPALQIPRALGKRLVIASDLTDDLLFA